MIQFLGFQKDSIHIIIHQPSEKIHTEDHSEVPRHCLQESNTSLKDIQHLVTYNISTSYNPDLASLSSFANDSESWTSDQQYYAKVSLHP